MGGALRPPRRRRRGPRRGGGPLACGRARLPSAGEPTPSAPRTCSSAVPAPAYVELIAAGRDESNPWLDRVRSARGPISWAVAVDDVDEARDGAGRGRLRARPAGARARAARPTATLVELAGLRRRARAVRRLAAVPDRVDDADGARARRRPGRGVARRSRRPTRTGWPTCCSRSGFDAEPALAATGLRASAGSAITAATRSGSRGQDGVVGRGTMRRGDARSRCDCRWRRSSSSCWTTSR